MTLAITYCHNSKRFVVISNTILVRDASRLVVVMSNTVIVLLQRVMINKKLVSYCYNTKRAVAKHCDVYNKTLAIIYCHNNAKGFVVMSDAYNKTLKDRCSTSDSMGGSRHYYSLVGY